MGRSGGRAAGIAAAAGGCAGIGRPDGGVGIARACGGAAGAGAGCGCCIEPERREPAGGSPGSMRRGPGAVGAGCCTAGACGWAAGAAGGAVGAVGAVGAAGAGPCGRIGRPTRGAAPGIVLLPGALPDGGAGTWRVPDGAVGACVIGGAGTARGNRSRRPSGAPGLAPAPGCAVAIGGTGVADRCGVGWMVARGGSGGAAPCVPGAAPGTATGRATPGGGT